MSWLRTEFQRIAGTESEEQVQAAVDRWQARIRERMRAETGLKLYLDNEGAGKSQRVEVNVCPGFPAAFPDYELKPEDLVAELAAMYRGELEKARSGTEAVVQLLVELAEHQQRTLFENPSDHVETAYRYLSVVQALLKAAGRANGLKKLFDIEEDILGAYFPGFPQPTGHGRSTVSRVVLYWVVIGAVAKQLSVSVEALTVVVLAHELAHAYTHLGADIDGNRWDTSLFERAETCIKEGLAQYYTFQVVRWLHDNLTGEPLAAYKHLLSVQSGPYRVHEGWVTDHSSEQVRAAMVEARNRGIRRYEEFRKLLNEAKTRLDRARPDPTLHRAR